MYVSTAVTHQANLEFWQAFNRSRLWLLVSLAIVSIAFY
jgi:hypothetical protein